MIKAEMDHRYAYLAALATYALVLFTLCVIVLKYEKPLRRALSRKRAATPSPAPINPQFARADHTRVPAETIGLGDIIREFERLNFRHVNDTDRPIGQLSVDYSYAVVELALQVEKTHPNWSYNTAEWLEKRVAQLREAGKI